MVIQGSETNGERKPKPKREMILPSPCILWTFTDPFIYPSCFLLFGGDYNSARVGFDVIVVVVDRAV